MMDLDNIPDTQTEVEESCGNSFVMGLINNLYRCQQSQAYAAPNRAKLVGDFAAAKP